MTPEVLGEDENREDLCKHHTHNLHVVRVVLKIEKKYCTNEQGRCFLDNLRFDVTRLQRRKRQARLEWSLSRRYGVEFGGFKTDSEWLQCTTANRRGCVALGGGMVKK